MEDLKRYASILENADVSINIDDMNELSNGPRKPGLLSGKPGDGDGGLQLPTPRKRRHTSSDTDASSDTDEGEDKKFKLEDSSP